MVILAALPGMVKVLRMTGKLVNPGNSSGIVNVMGSQLRFLGLGSHAMSPEVGIGVKYFNIKDYISLTRLPLHPSRRSLGGAKSTACGTGAAMILGVRS